MPDRKNSGGPLEPGVVEGRVNRAGGDRAGWADRRGHWPALDGRGTC